MHSKYDNMHRSGIFYALICINKNVITGVSCMLSLDNARSTRQNVDNPHHFTSNLYSASHYENMEHEMMVMPTKFQL